MIKLFIALSMIMITSSSYALELHNAIILKHRAWIDGKNFGMAQKPPVLVNIMRVEFYPDVLPFRHEYYDSIAL